MAVIALPHLSATFDAVACDINGMSVRFKDRIGIIGTHVAWIDWYLADRRQNSQVSDRPSAARPVTSGVPLRFLLGSLVLSFCARDLSVTSPVSGTCSYTKHPRKLSED